MLRKVAAVLAFTFGVCVVIAAAVVVGVELGSDRDAHHGGDMRPACTVGFVDELAHPAPDTMRFEVAGDWYTLTNDTSEEAQLVHDAYLARSELVVCYVWSGDGPRVVHGVGRAGASGGEAP